MAARWEAIQRSRLAPTRPSTPGGDVEAEARLYRDVGGTVVRAVGHPAGLALRTRVVDAQVAQAFGRGVEQVVLVGAGYDGRALRFGGGPTRWFEVDRPALLADKDERLRSLGIGAANRRAVGADLELDGLGDVLEGAGHLADRPSLFVCEWVLAALTLAAAASLCETLRARAPAGSTLVTGFPVAPEPAAPARALREATGLFLRATGEPRRNEFRPGDPEKLLVVTGWRTVHTEATAARRLDRGAHLLLTVSEPGTTRRR